jgi:hypothetical protein
MLAMSHPAIGLPPSDATAGRPDVAARLRGADRLPALALEAAIRVDGTLPERHDELMLRRFLRDYGQHVEQLARAVETEAGPDDIGRRADAREKRRKPEGDRAA